MADTIRLDDRARTFFDGLWKHGDPWQFDSSVFERGKYNRQIELVADRRYERVLEIGCGAGVFTRQLAALARVVVAMDVSPVAIGAARASGASDRAGSRYCAWQGRGSA